MTNASVERKERVLLSRQRPRGGTPAHSSTLHPLGAVAIPSTVGRSTNADFFKQAWETAHKQGMQEHDRIHQNNLCATSYNLRGAYSDRRLRIYGFTPLPPTLLQHPVHARPRMKLLPEYTARQLKSRTAMD